MENSYSYIQLFILSPLVADLNLDGPLSGVCSKIKGCHGIFKLETMGNEGFHVNEATRDEPNCLGVLPRTAQIPRMFSIQPRRT